ncbi:DUF1963 domain-containing protein [Actinacidiphila sp. bgisy144]|uniref:DUF1963 domain-containing protein n=1 Tax=unclassified Actinacidiphila TaxID=2995708 RepID=UPI003EBCE4F3
MDKELLDRLAPFRDEAVEQGIPLAEVERWTAAAARPCASLSTDGDGPVVGHFGGPLLLPPELPDPYYPLIATIDLAALPADATDLQLPAGGHLLLFAHADDPYGRGGGGEALYLPPGTAVEEREVRDGATDFSDDAKTQEQVLRLLEQYPQGEMRLSRDVLLPSYSDPDVPDHFWTALVRDHPRAEQMSEVWDEVGWRIPGGGPLQLGGYPSDEYGGEGFHRESPDGQNPRDWVLLADWHPGLEGREGLTVHWPIRLPDLAAGRFDQAAATIFWNP